MDESKQHIFIESDISKFKRAEEERRKLQEAREAELIARRDWHPKPWFSKTPLVPEKQAYATERTTPQDDPGDIKPIWTVDL
jgi:hypothetical protein